MKLPAVTLSIHLTVAAIGLFQQPAMAQTLLEKIFQVPTETKMLLDLTAAAPDTS